MKNLIILLTLGCLISNLKAAETVDPSVKIREQLRAVTLQLRTAQTDAANAQSAQAGAELKSKELVTKLSDSEKRNGSITKQSNADKLSSEKAIADLNNKLEDREQRITKYAESLATWKLAYQKASALARTKEEARAKLAAEKIVCQRTILDRERKNISLFNTSNEILNRYENFSLGKALQAREPFIGTTRVKIESFVQGYKDRILDNRISASAGNR